MAGHTRNAFHLKQAKQYAQQAIEGKAKAGPGWKDDPVVAAGLTHLAEACAEHMGNIPREVQAKYEGVPWQQMADFRNIASHSYHRIDLQIVAGIIDDDLPTLVDEIDVLLGDGV